jgi:hypothetical protein
MAELQPRGLSAKCSNGRVMRDPPKRQNDPRPWRPGQFVHQERPAGQHLGGQRLVLGWHAPYGIGHTAIDEAEAICWVGTIDAFAKPMLRQRRIEYVPSEIPGERPAGTVGTAQARRQTDDQDTGIHRTEGGHGRVMPTGELHPVGGTKGGKPGAKRAVGRRGRPQGSRVGQVSTCSSSSSSSLTSLSRSSTAIGRGVSRAINGIRSARSTKKSAWRRNSSAISGG